MKVPSLVVALAICLAAGCLEWYLRYDGCGSAKMKQAAQRIDALPMSWGSWQGEALSSDEEHFKASNLCRARVWMLQDSLSGERIVLAVGVGSPGPTAEHLPEVSFPSLGYIAVKGGFRRRDASTFAEGVAGQWAEMEFRHPKQETPTRVWQSWFDGRNWSRPDYARFHFLNKSVLYRVDVWSPLVRNPLTQSEEVMDDPCQAFLADHLAEITKALSDESPSALP